VYLRAWALGELKTRDMQAVELSHTEIHPALLQLLLELHIVDGTANTDKDEEDFYTGVLCQLGRGNHSVHHPILSIVGRLLCDPLCFVCTGEYIDLWEGTYVVRRDRVSELKWARLMDATAALDAARLVTVNETPWHDGVSVSTYIGSSSRDAAVMDSIPWRMIAFRLFLRAVLNIGLKCPRFQTELVHALQVACDGTKSRLRIDKTAYQLFPSESHLNCLIQLLPLVSMSIARAWEGR
jgi:hypothetical protein